MKKTSLLLALIFFVFTNTLFLGQKHKFLDPPKFNDADLSKPKSLIDENAPAEILYRSVHYYIDLKRGGELIKDIFYRVKIYDKDKASQWLDLEIPLYKSKSNKEEVLSSAKAYVYNLENGKKIETKVDKSSKYKSKENKYVTITKFAFPNVKNGSVLEFKYEVSSPFLYEIPTCYIDLDTPSIYTEYVLDSPVNISYNIDYTGDIAPKYRMVEKALLYGEDCNTYRFGYENLASFKKEKFVKNDENYRTKIRAELHSTNFNNHIESYSSSWESIRKNLYEDEDFGVELKKERLVKDLIPSAAISEKNPIAKANIIFDYVKKTFTWNEKNGIVIENGFRDLITTKTGNDADINLFLVAMLREAGLDANPVLISTVDNGVINMTYPNIANFNFVLACVEYNGNYHLYDATAKQSSENLLPPRDWNSTGVLMTDKKALQLNITNTKMSYNYLTAVAKISEDGVVSGTYSDKDTGVFSMSAKESYDQNPEKYKKQYKESFSVDFSNIDSKIVENGDFESTMSFSSSNLIDAIGKKLVINPILFLNKTANEFDQTEGRKYPIDFLTPSTRVKKVEIEIPEGYVVEALPKNKKISTDDKEISYSYIVEQVGNKIIANSTIVIASSDYPKEYYPAFKQIWKVIVDTQGQVISLVKK